MELEKTVEDQMSMATSLFDLLINNPLSWIVVVLTPVVALATFLIFGSLLSIFFTATALMLSTSLFIFCKRKPKFVLEKSSVKEEIHKSVHGSSPQVEDALATKEQRESDEMSARQKQDSEGGEGGSYQNIHGYFLRSPDVLSEKECADQLPATEDSEVDWPFRDNTDRSLDYSDVDDGSISDEDSLIEISLPGRHNVSHIEEDEPNTKYIMHQKLPDFMPGSFFQQRSLMELLAEFNDMNEEDNLIEIDISMGSIKCSRFEIEA